MAYKTRVANPKKKSSKKKKDLDSDVRAALRDFIDGKEFNARRPTKKKVTEIPADMRSALGKPRSSKGKEAVFGKSSKKKATKKKVAKKKTAKKATKKKTAARAPSVAELRSQLKELQKTCGVLLKRLGKSTEPADRRRMKADIRKAITSNSACRLAAQRWGSPSPSCNRRHPLPKGYKGPKGAKQLGEYSTKKKWRGAPSLNNAKFWGD